jgi:uncharacterized protein YukE
MGAGPQPTPTPTPTPTPAPAQGQGTGGGQYYSDGRGKANDYQPPPAIQSTWPASFSGGGELTVNRDTLRQVSNAMKQDIAEIQAVLSDLQENGLITELQLGNWDAPSGLAAATGNAFAGITNFVNDLIQAHGAVSDRINTSANAYSDAEANNTALSNGIAT